MRILVTGGTGFVGSHLVSRLVKKGQSIRVLVRKNSDVGYLKKLNVELCVGDITDKNSVKAAVKGIDLVYHIAALFRQARFPDRVFWQVNVEGTRNMLEASYEEGVKRFVHCSTIGVLGNIINPPADETYSYNPGDVYQRSKCEGEKIALKFFRDKKFPAVVARPTAVYGPGDTRLLKLFKYVSSSRIIILGDGKPFYHLVYVEDLITGFELCAQKENAVGKVYILGGDKYLTLNELVDLIAKVLGVSLSKIHLPVFPFKVLGTLCEEVCIPLRIEPPLHRRRVDFFTKSRAFDISKAKRELGYKPGFDLETGLRLTGEWYREKGILAKKKKTDQKISPNFFKEFIKCQESIGSHGCRRTFSEGAL